MRQLRLIQTHVCLVAVMLVFPCAAPAQTTSDGVRAFLLGDYQAAARILQPLAEAVPQPDPLAQYSMAMLYDSGRGVALDIPITLTGIVGWLPGWRGVDRYIADKVGAKYQLQNSIAPKATKCQRMSSGCVIPRIMNSRLSVARAITSARATAIASSTVVATNIIKTIYRSNHAVV